MRSGILHYIFVFSFKGLLNDDPFVQRQINTLNEFLVLQNRAAFTICNSK